MVRCSAACVDARAAPLLTGATCVTDEAPFVARVEELQNATSGAPFAYLVAAGLFDDRLDTAEDMAFDVRLAVVEGGLQGGVRGLTAQAFTDGRFEIAGTPLLVGDHVIRVMLHATDRTGQSASTEFDIFVTGEGGSPLPQSSPAVR